MNIKNIFKISIIILILLLSISSIYASDDLDEADDDEDFNDNFDLDDDMDDEDLDDSDEYDDIDDEDLDDSDEYDEDLDDFEEENITDFDYLKYKLSSYLTKYGNESGNNWTLSQEFLDEYEIYLTNSFDYTLNESSEAYQTYLKIFDSVTSTFNEYNLTENETEYLKFMIIFYLNHYGNLSENYTWNESDEFDTYIPPIMYLSAMAGFKSPIKAYSQNLSKGYYSPVTSNENLTQYDNQTNSFEIELDISGIDNIVVLFLIIFLIILIIL